MKTSDGEQPSIAHLPFIIVNEAARAPVLIHCDHASRHIPASYDNLGLGADQLERHIAWDIGAGEVSRRLANLLEATAVLCGTSRLVIDCNRPFWADSSIPLHSDGVIIPGNNALDEAERQQRIERYFHPYHDEIARRIKIGVHAGTGPKTGAGAGHGPALISIHSFTPVMDGFERPWHVGMLWDKDDSLAVPVIRELRRDGTLCVGANKPYDGANPPGYALHTHAADNGLPIAVFEIRQDLIDTEQGAARWAQILATALEPVLAAHTANDDQRQQ